MAPNEAGDELVFFVNGKKVSKIPAFCPAFLITYFSSNLFPPLKCSDKNPYSMAFKC